MSLNREWLAAAAVAAAPDGDTDTAEKIVQAYLDAGEDERRREVTEGLLPRIPWASLEDWAEDLLSRAVGDVEE